MSGEIKVGFSMHPRWAGALGLRAFVEPLRQAGLEVLEFELDRNLDMWPDFQPLMESAVELGFDLSFHAPYRVPYSLAGFCGARRAAIIRDYAPMLLIAEEWSRRLPGLRSVVVHAASARLPADLDSLAADTRAFLAWALETFPHLCFALENNHPAKPGELKAGDSRAAVLKILSGLPANPRLRACWDMGHDYLADPAGEPTPSCWRIRLFTKSELSTPHSWQTKRTGLCAISGVTSNAYFAPHAH